MMQGSVRSFGLSSFKYFLHPSEAEELFIMIDDRFPELKELAPGEQLELASELAKVALNADDLYQLSEESVLILESELAEVIENPSKGTRWEELKKMKND
jgi:hypothetical protein